MDIIEAIRSRRSIRRFAARPVPRDLVEEVVRAGTWAPSGGNVQPVRYVVVDDGETIAKVRAVSPGMAGSDPAVLVVVCMDADLVRRRGGDSSRTVPIMDVAMAAQNMQIAAYALGLGACAIASFLGSSVRLILDIPANLDPVLMMSLGYPAERPVPPERRPLNEVLHWGRFTGANSPKKAARRDEPGGLSGRLLELLCFMAVCARNCVDEPAVYGPLRLIEAAGWLIDVMVDHDLDSAGVAQVRDVIEASRDCVMTDHPRFVRMLDEVAGLLTSRLEPGADRLPAG